MKVIMKDSGMIMDVMSEKEGMLTCRDSRGLTKECTEDDVIRPSGKEMSELRRKLASGFRNITHGELTWSQALDTMADYAIGVLAR